jgi:FAR1 DNA-binding domain
MSGRNMEFNNDIGWIPELEMEFQTEEEVWQFWKNYSGRMGFNVRKHYGHKSRVDGTTTSMVFVCSNEGNRGKDKRDEHTKNPRAETQTSCKVRLGVKFIRKTN